MPHEDRHPDDFTPEKTGPPDLLEELERMDMAVKAQGIEEERTMFDPDSHPKKPHRKEEGTTTLDGSREVDLQEDTLNLDLLTTDTDLDVGTGELLDAVDMRDVEIL